MKLGKYVGQRPITKLAVWCSVLVAMFMFFTLGVAVVAALGGNVSSIVGVRWLLVAQDLAFFILPAFVVACLWSNDPLAWLHVQPVRSGNKWAIVLLAILIPICCLPLNNMFVGWGEQINLPSWLQPMEEWIREMEEKSSVLTEQLLATESVGGLVANLMVVALLAGLGEELCFRGVLQNIVSERSPKDSLPHVPIWVTAIVFSAIHFQFYGFVPRMLLGALFGYTLCWTGSIWIPILMHFVNNGFVVIAVFIGKKQGLDVEALDAIGTGDTMWLGVISLVVTVMLIYLLRRSTTISNASSRTSIGS